MEEDTRENLEADVNAWFPPWNYTDDFRNAVFGLLDRQAAITEREILSHPDERDEQIAELKSIAEKYREDAIAAQKELENTKRAMNRAAGKWAKADADATEWMHIIDCLEDRISVRDKSIERLERHCDEVSAERDAYRELCGRMRKIANEMLVMEVD